MDRNLADGYATIDTNSVALRTEGVDRNYRRFQFCRLEKFVALRTEGVDRNPKMATILCKIHKVALRTEGVDRNGEIAIDSSKIVESPSARRAWIEIFIRRDTMRVLIGRPPHGGRG